MNSQKNKPTFIIKTVGCKVNQYESELMRENLLNVGFFESEIRDIADLYIINSCTVTHKADRDTRRLVRHFYRMNPNAEIVVCGCYAELDEDRKRLAELPGVSFLIRNNEKENIAEIISSGTMHKVSKKISGLETFKGRDRAFVKIQDGCNHHCSYCKVSLVRGPSVSKSEMQVLEEVRRLVEAGYKEIVLTGVCVGAWGRDLKQPLSLDFLVRKICAISTEFRVRISSIEPLYVTDDLINAVSELPNACNHFHIPLQSGDDKILRLMNRPYNTKQFLLLRRRIEKKIPRFGLTTDVMIGFPGEDERSFKRTLNFIKKVAPIRIHIFTYSKREGTMASRMPAMNDIVVLKRRKDRMQALWHSLNRRYAERLRGKRVDVVVESTRDKLTDYLAGYTGTYLRVLFDGPDEACGTLLAATITDVSKKGIFVSPPNLDKGPSL
ncbi:MAG: tRNA (N(6)-L-threonylcarbamoyladenosine(37)-C(2))-methylthiotransferase MtaB [Candidatus Omnitrophica bacterium]|nr:tRNA (N(6)-L-threonylcarbamoyladenosine(37)-C(2))-methylthiotransferase MtaB [Candidatus Omnitrophota bacterium]